MKTLDPKIMKYVPKSKVDAIRDAYRDEDGYWITLNDGWVTGDDCQTIHEDTIKDLRYQIGGINKIDLQDAEEATEAEVNETATTEEETTVTKEQIREAVREFKDGKRAGLYPAIYYNMDARRKYDEANTVQVKIKLNKKTDADIIAYLEASGNKQGTIKEALREKMALNEELDGETVELMKEFIEGEKEKQLAAMLQMCTEPVSEKN